MLYNDSYEFESAFLGLTTLENNSVMLESLSGSRLGIWIAHGKGKFSLPEEEKNCSIVARYSHNNYPGDPNGSSYSMAGICSKNGRHLAMIPHLERSVFPWQNAYYPYKQHTDEVAPWMEAFMSAREWVEKQA